MTFDVETLRDQVLYEVEKTSLRAVARDVSMSPTGLKKLIVERTLPYAPTRRKLHRWMQKREQIAAPAAPAPELVARCVDVLLSDIPADVQQPIRLQIAKCLTAAFAHHRGGEFVTSLLHPSLLQP